MNDEYDERWVLDRRTDKTIVSKRFTDTQTGKALRIASHALDVQSGLRFALVKDEVVLRVTPGGRYEIKATFLEDDRFLRSVTIQKYSNRTGPLDKQYFAFVGGEIDALLTFLAGIKTVPLDDAGKVHLPDDVVRSIVLDKGEARRLFANNPELFLQLAQQEDITRDLVAVGYRRKQLRYFEALLRDAAYFAQEQQRLQCRPEDVWQKFFEGNTWIFGYGLSYQFLSKLDDRKLEQIVRGSDVTGAGKRTDGLMKTRGRISSLCFVESKRHDTPLLGTTQYRADVWSPSLDLSAGVSQLQATAHAAMQAIGEKLTPRDKSGDPSGEILFNIEPQSCLVIGSLSQFQTEHGINVPKLRSFELYRRNTWRPEIITFDELLERARFIVEHTPDANHQLDREDDVLSC